MKIAQKLIVILIGCQLLTGCHSSNPNPLKQMPVKQAATLLLTAAKASNSKAGLQKSSDTYLLCLGDKLDASSCQRLYELMSDNLKEQGLAINKNTFARFMPSDALKKELQYQALIDDED